MGEKRIEVWFTDGLFRAFPNVTECVMRDTYLHIIFAGGHEANIYVDKVNFMEYWETVPGDEIKTE